MNRLANETSPYLQQHADNPVDWYPWGPEALALARDNDRPILLSVGYSACHWCHVMAHESFEDPMVAAVMNSHFVNVKVDREERPDLDEIYMQAVQAFTGGHGGWPMTVFLTPDGKPFFGGTYFPPEPRPGLPSFRQVLEHASSLWRSRRQEVDRVTGELVPYLKASERLPKPTGTASEAWLDKLAEACARDFDEVDGGFGGAPKFPPHGQLAALLAHHHRSGDDHALHVVTHTLDRMAHGGMYDLLGGGFARYSVDPHWRVPHFEKMLYDNALLVPIYVDAWKLTGKTRYGRVVRETLGWMQREMASPGGGFCSALDADSEGEEGKFYVWTPAEIRSVLGVLDGMRACTALGVTDQGSFEHGTSVLQLEGEVDDAWIEKLLAAREQRVRPGRDDKVLTAWNALAISAFARAGAAFDDPEWRGAAVKAARFLLDTATVDGRLQRTWKDGRAHVPAFADDHAFLVNALIDLYEATLDLDWLGEANALADRLVELFWDDADGGLYYTGSDAEPLVTRSKHLLGGAEPSANGAAALAFARLADLSGRDDLGRKADRILQSYRALLDRAPRALGVEALAGAWRQGPTQQLGIVGGHAEALLREYYGRYQPFCVLAWLPDAKKEALLPWMEGKHEAPGEPHPTPLAYLCENRACLAPAAEAVELRAQLERAGRPREEKAGPPRPHAPPLPADADAWINTDRPLTLEALRGNVVVLDFWTYCCINCMHVLPELAAAEEAFAGQPVAFVGVHSAKFPAERERDNVERAVRRHRVRHPVVNDATHAIWDQYAVKSWPTVVVLDPTGRIAWRHAGEVTHEELVAVVTRVLAKARADGTLGEPAWRLPSAAPAGHGLRHPGKVHVWPDMPGQSAGADPFGPDARLYVADTGNHRILECSLRKGLDGWPVAMLRRAWGGNGPGLVDGPCETARFQSPQGIARAGHVLWIADTENHALRAIDLLTEKAHTVAGTGRLGRGEPAGPHGPSLRSPWDVACSYQPGKEADAVLVAMAGAHQIWIHVPEQQAIGPFCGSGREDHVDGAPAEAALAQPSGLALAGRYLFFADSETSSIRVLDLGEHKVGTLCGRGLFDWGDVDGPAGEARLQHPLGVAVADGAIYVADTFNGKVKVIHLRDMTVRTLAAGLAEPGGLTVAGDFLIVADTNAHRLAAVHRTTGEVRELAVGTAG
ncbi:MAG: DUF255 domain-containing protein [Myxococcota bacterium]